MKQQMMSEIVGKLSGIGISVQNGDHTDISILTEFLDAGWSTGSKKINYEAYVFIDEQSKTVFMYEKTSEVGHGLSFGTDSKSSFQSGATLFRKVKSVQYGLDGKAYEYTLDLGAIPKSIKETSKNYGYKFKTVLSKNKAQYPPGYVPSIAIPVVSVSTAPGMGQAQGGFCPNCGALIASNAKFCEKCGRSVNMQQSMQYGAPQSASHLDAKAAAPKSRAGTLGLICIILLAVITFILNLIMGVNYIGWISSVVVLVVLWFIYIKISGKGCIATIFLWIITVLILFFILVFFSKPSATKESAANGTVENVASVITSSENATYGTNGNSNNNASLIEADESIESNPYRIIQYYDDCTLTLNDKAPEGDFIYDLAVIYRVRTHFKSMDYSKTAKDDIIKSVITDIRVVEGSQKGKISHIGLFKYGQYTIDNPDNYIEVENQKTKYENIFTVSGFTEDSVGFFVMLDNIAEYSWDGSQKANIEYFREKGITSDDIRVMIGYKIELHSKSGKVYYKDCTVDLFPKDLETAGTVDTGSNDTVEEAFSIKK